MHIVGADINIEEMRVAMAHSVIDEQADDVKKKLKWQIILF